MKNEHKKRVNDPPGHGATKTQIYFFKYGLQTHMFCWRVAHVGGNLNNGDNSGPFYLNFNNSSANRNTNNGAQLCLYIKNIALPVNPGSCQNIKKQNLYE